LIEKGNATYQLENPIVENPIEDSINSDVFLMQLESIQAKIWKFASFTKFPYTSKPNANTFEGIGFSDEKGTQTLKVSVRDLSDKTFEKFAKLSIVDGKITGIELLAQTVAFGVKVEQRPFTESECVIELA
jgi:hypothetical protein